MCCVTGWVDYERNLHDRSKVIQAMTDTMALRGPDAQGVWIDRHVASAIGVSP
jgi:asparagine synthase (glutamine-hydrolysing)